MRYHGGFKEAEKKRQSVFEAQPKPKQIKEMTSSIKKMMSSEAFFETGDNARVYRISGNCDVTVFGSCVSSEFEHDIFILVGETHRMGGVGNAIANSNRFQTFDSSTTGCQSQ